METLVAVIHILVALILVGLVLIQDSKGGGALGIGGGGSNSLLGATGAQTLAARMTRWMAVLFAITSISLTYFSGQKGRSVLDAGAPVSGPVIPPASGAPGAPGVPATATAPAAEAPVAAPTGAPAEAPAAH